ncbi:hypothetical protein Ancab_024066 [Ancistrocladus abbreviatus]
MEFAQLLSELPHHHLNDGKWRRIQRKKQITSSMNRSPFESSQLPDLRRQIPARKSQFTDPSLDLAARSFQFATRTWQFTFLPTEKVKVERGKVWGLAIFTSNATIEGAPIPGSKRNYQRP